MSLQRPGGLEQGAAKLICRFCGPWRAGLAKGHHFSVRGVMYSGGVAGGFGLQEAVLRAAANLGISLVL